LKVKLHRYMNAGTVSVVQLPSSHHDVTTAAVPRVASTWSTLPMARCSGTTLPRPVQPYYNDIASTGMTPKNPNSHFLPDGLCLNFDY